MYLSEYSMPLRAGDVLKVPDQDSIEPTCLLLIFLHERYGLIELSGGKHPGLVAMLNSPDTGQDGVPASWLQIHWKQCMQESSRPDLAGAMPDQIEVLDRYEWAVGDLSCPEQPALNLAQDTLLDPANIEPVRGLLRLPKGEFVALAALVPDIGPGLRDIRVSWNVLDDSEYKVGIVIFDSGSFSTALIAHTGHYLASIGMEMNAHSRST